MLRKNATITDSVEKNLKLQARNSARRSLTSDVKQNRRERESKERERESSRQVPKQVLSES